MSKAILVYADWKYLASPTLVGTLHSDILRGKEVFSFDYDNRWLEEHRSSFLDPDLQMYGGRQYVQDNRTLFGVFTDCCPDRWGRLLMKRRESILAREEGRNPRTLLESDYLLGIQDSARMGALRFKLEADGPFLSTDSSMPIPVWTSLRELEQAAVNIDADTGTGKEERAWLRLLVQPGSSLGGARPKATVRDTDGNLWIAKFPSRNDEINTGAWEMVTHKLASGCGLRVPEAKCESYSPTGSTFLVKRFDRTDDGKRLHYLSAMTVLGESDGSGSEEGVSYLDMAGVIRQYGSRVKEDLLELWKRIVFSIAVTNTDDHLRNHGFLFNRKGMELSPLFDVNPNPDGNVLSLNINDSDNSLDFDLAIDSAPYFDIRKDDASKMINEMKSRIASWSYIAQSLGISRAEIGMMERCFRIR